MKWVACGIIAIDLVIMARFYFAMQTKNYYIHKREYLQQLRQQLAEGEISYLGFTAKTNELLVTPDPWKVKVNTWLSEHKI